MNATSLSRTLAVLTSFIGVMACQDTSGPQAPPEIGRESVSLVPRSATIEAGRTVALKATLRDEFGDALAATFEWRSSNDVVATVAATGEVYGRSAGVAVVTASAHGKSERSTVRVLARPPKEDTKGIKEPELLRRRL
jgi:hypothetical protein